jgi:hypothetical protein
MDQTIQRHQERLELLQIAEPCLQIRYKACSLLLNYYEVVKKYERNQLPKLEWLDQLALIETEKAKVSRNLFFLTLLAPPKIRLIRVIC